MSSPEPLKDLDQTSAQRRGAIAWMTQHGVAPNMLMALLLIGGVVHGAVETRGFSRF